MKTIPKLTGKQIERFWKYIDIPNQLLNKNACWLWNGLTNIHGYGVFGLNRKSYNAQRIMYLLSYPAWKQDTYICHKCDNPQCCNPKHLFAGTAKDNVIDRDNKGRGKVPDQKGSNHSRTKLTEANIIDMRKQYAQGVKQGTLAKQYNIGQYQVSRIVNHKRWTHI